MLSPRPVIPLRVPCGAAIRRRTRTMHTHTHTTPPPGDRISVGGVLGGRSLNARRVVCYYVLNYRMGGNKMDLDNIRIYIFARFVDTLYTCTRRGVGDSKTTRRGSSTAPRFDRRQHSCWSSARTANTGTVSGHRLPNEMPHLPYGSHRQQLIRRVVS